MISAGFARTEKSGRISAAGSQAIQGRFARRMHHGHYRDRRRATGLEIARGPNQATEENPNYATGPLALQHPVGGRGEEDIHASEMPSVSVADPGDATRLRPLG